jgi:hypothetical protein
MKNGKFSAMGIRDSGAFGKKGKTSGKDIRLD